MIPSALARFNPADWLAPEDLDAPPGYPRPEVWPGLQAWRRYRAERERWRAAHPSVASAARQQLH